MSINRSKIVTAILTVIFLCSLVATVASVVSARKDVPNHGILAQADIGVYSNQECTVALAAVDWGLVEPGETAHRTVYIKNLGTADLNLSVTAINWSPNESIGTLTITVGKTSLISGESTSILMTFTMDPSSVGFREWNFNLAVYGEKTA